MFVLKSSSGNENYQLFVKTFPNLDINECEGNMSGCNDSCVDTIGSFYCECHDMGYEVGLDGFSCIGMYIRVTSRITLHVQHP